MSGARQHGGTHGYSGGVIFASRKGGLSDDEKRAVRAFRQRGMNWSATARAVGRSEPDIRAVFDPTYQQKD